jgi:hypothetical protein
MVRVDVAVPMTADVTSLTDPTTFLPSPARQVGPDRYVIDLVVWPWHHDALVELGPIWRAEGRVGRSLTWAPAPAPNDALPYERLMPSVHGVLVVTPGKVALRAHYEPVGGRVGYLLDRFLGRAARTSMRRFVEAVAHTLETASATAVHDPGGT